MPGPIQTPLHDKIVQICPFGMERVYGSDQLQSKIKQFIIISTRCFLSQLELIGFDIRYAFGA